MNLKSRLILEDYRKQRDSFVKLGDVAHQMLADIAKELGLTVLAVEHRVKEERSLAGKLERKGDGYNTTTKNIRYIFKTIVSITLSFKFTR